MIHHNRNFQKKRIETINLWVQFWEKLFTVFNDRVFYLFFFRFGFLQRVLEAVAFAGDFFDVLRGLVEPLLQFLVPLALELQLDLQRIGLRFSPGPR